jgi:glucokinase
MIADRKETTVAVDVGGTHMRAALVSDVGEVLFRREIPTPHESAKPTELIDLIRSVAAHATTLKTSCQEVIVGLPGQIDYHAGTLLWAPHLPSHWPEQLTETLLAQAIGLTVHLANDADVAAVGEAFFGAGRRHGDVAYITISTGIGGGLVFSDRLVHASRSLAELGQTIIDWKAWHAHQPASLEELASGTGLTRMAEAVGLGPIAGPKIEELVGKGDVLATQIWESAVGAAAVGIINIIAAFSPEIIVIGGGLGLQESFFSGIQTSLESSMPAHLSLVPLAQAELGDNAGLVGSARWVLATT